MVSKSKSKNLRRNIKQPIFCRLATKSASGVKYEGNPPETIKTIERLTRAVVNNYNKGQRWFIISLSVANWKIDSLFEDYDDDDDDYDKGKVRVMKMMILMADGFTGNESDVVLEDDDDDPHM